jgi:hypothetical protein
MQVESARMPLGAMTMNTVKYAAVLKLACLAALVSSSSTHGATHLETLPVRMPSCEVDAAVQIKFNTERQPLTYKVRSYYWDHGALAFRIERGKFAMAAYENRSKKDGRFWLKGWDTFLGDQLTPVDNGLIPWNYKNVAHLADIYDLLTHEPSSADYSVSYLPWEKVAELGDRTVFRRKMQVGISEAIRKLNPKLPPTEDFWTTVTLKNGEYPDSAIQAESYAVRFEDYSPEGIPVFVVHTIMRNRPRPPFHAASIESRAENIRLLGPQETEELILPELTKGLRRINKLPYSPPEVSAREAAQKGGVLGMFLQFLIALLYPALLPLSAGIIVLLIVRKLRLL